MVYKQEQYEQEHEQYQEYDQHGNPIHRDDQERGLTPNKSVCNCMLNT